MLDALKRLLFPDRDAAAGPRAGLSHYQREVDGQPVRYHLRVERDGSGLLIANAAAAVRLSPVGVTITSELLGGQASDEDVAEQITTSFRGATGGRALEDVRRVRSVLDELADPAGRYPLLSLDDDPEAGVHRRTLSAPLCADVVVADPIETRSRLSRLWDAAVPQVVLIAASSSDAEALVQLVEHAEDLGLIAGVRARASDLEAEGLLEDLAQAGLDHLDVPYAGPHAIEHDELLGNGDHVAAERLMRRALALEVCPVAFVPLVSTTLDSLDETAARLVELRVPAVVAYAIATEEDAPDDDEAHALGPTELVQAATTAEELADDHGLNFVWAAPTERRASLSLAEQVRAGPRTGGEACVRLETDGAVLPPTGVPDRAGIIDTDAWTDIWSHEAFEHYRESVDAPARCKTCPGLALCSAGCPKITETWARAPRADAHTARSDRDADGGEP
jgi:radical SAM protein with 4Fe4S-binding SPASM domain